MPYTHDMPESKHCAQWGSSTSTHLFLGGQRFFLSSACLLGFFTQLQQARLWPIVIYIAIFLVSLISICILYFLRFSQRKPKFIYVKTQQENYKCPASWLFTVLLAFLFTLLCFAWVGLRASIFEKNALHTNLIDKDIRVTGIIAAMPRWHNHAVHFRFATESAFLTPDQSVRLPPYIDVAWYTLDKGRELKTGLVNKTSTISNSLRNLRPADLPDLRVGERWVFNLRLRTPHGSRNPHGFDYELWLWGQGVQATATVLLTGTAPPMRKIGFSDKFSMERLRQSVRSDIENHLLPHNGEKNPTQKDWQMRSTGVISALVTGDQQAIDLQDWNVFRATGVAHLVAISGLHITMFAGLAMRLSAFLWRRSRTLMLWYAEPTASLWGGLMLALFYAVFSGWGVPAQRTIWMLFIWVFLRSMGLRWPWHTSLAIAAAIILTIDPWALLQSGFWLSFVAVAVLFMLEEKTYSSAEYATQNSTNVISIWSKKIYKIIQRSILSLWSLQWRITLVLAPLTITLFGQVSLISLIANMLAIPVVTLLVTPLAMLGIAFAPAWSAAAWCMSLLMQFLDALAVLPSAMLHTPIIPLWLTFLASFSAAIIALRGPWFIRVMGLPMLALALLWYPNTPPKGEFKLLATDIGQGAAVLVQTQHHALLYDTGPKYRDNNSAGKSILVPLLHHHAIKPDVVLISHIDTDHSGGAKDVLQEFPSARVMATFSASALSIDWLDSSDFQAPLNVPWHYCEQNKTWWWDGVRFEILHPQQEWLKQSLNQEKEQIHNVFKAKRYKPIISSNSLSCVLKITSNSGAKALLTGDIELIQEIDLRLQYGDQLAADFLLVPHHGSRASSSARFIDAIKPKFAVAQAGYRSRFGHPAPEVVARYKQRGTYFVSTAQCGAAQWYSLNREKIICERQKHLRYWHHD